jgi:hypothetical protein
MIIGDALCFVLADNRSKENVFLVLNKYIPDYEKIQADNYSFNLTNEMEFETEEQMIEYLVMTKGEHGTLYWNKKENNPHRIMVGAHFTTDGELIMSLTLPGDDVKEEKYLEDLKRTLNSDTGVIYYNCFPDFKDGADFRNKYGLQHKI